MYFDVWFNLRCRGLYGYRWICVYFGKWEDIRYGEKVVGSSFDNSKGKEWENRKVILFNEGIRKDKAKSVVIVEEIKRKFSRVERLEI